MKKQTIEVEGLPEGWKAKEFRLGEVNEPYYDPATKSICRLLLGSTVGVLIVEKIKPRRIVLEEVKDGSENPNEDKYFTSKWWREVKETDIPLNNDEPKLSLSVDECKYILGRSSKYSGNVFDKIGEFIR